MWLPGFLRKNSPSSIVLDVSDVILNTVEDAARASPVPFFREAAGLSKGILVVIQNTRNNRDGFKNLATDVCSLVYAIVCTERVMSPKEMENLKELLGTLGDIERFARMEGRRTLFLRIIRNKSDLEKIQRFRETLKHSLDLFGLKANLGIQENLALILQRQNDVVNEMRADRERREVERMERERQETERIERERQERLRIESEKVEREHQERIRSQEEQNTKRIREEMEERERQEKLRRQQEEQERTRVEAETVERERLEKLRLAKEEQERVRTEQEILRLEAEERERVRVEMQREERQRLEALRLKKEVEERERIAAEQAEREQLERLQRRKEDQERMRAEVEQAEREKLEKIQSEKEAQEKAQTHVEIAEREQLARLRLEIEAEKEQNHMNGPPTEINMGSVGEGAARRVADGDKHEIVNGEAGDGDLGFGRVNQGAQSGVVLPQQAKSKDQRPGGRRRNGKKNKKGKK